MTTAVRHTAPPRTLIAEAVYRDGIAGLPAAFPPTWADDLHADAEQAFTAARRHPRGTVSRGPNRHYFAVHPQQVRRFPDLASLPVLTSVCAEVLGEDYRIIELGFDVPLADAMDQPWHRDFRSPPGTSSSRILTSLAFNVPTVDVAPDMAPFEIAPGTHWDDGAEFAHGMFPGPEAAQRYARLGERRHPRRGDMSVRTGLTIHRGTANSSDRARAVLIIGVVTGRLAESRETDMHEIHVTRGYRDRLPAVVREHLRCRVVDELRPIVQRHDIEGLVMG